MVVFALRVHLLHKLKPQFKRTIYFKSVTIMTFFWWRCSGHATHAMCAAIPTKVDPQRCNRLVLWVVRVRLCLIEV